MKRCQRRFAAFCCLWATVISACLPVFAQSVSSPDAMSLSEAMSGRPFPLTLPLSDIVAAPENWRQFSLSSGEVAPGLSGIPEVLYQSVLGPYLTYFTQGKTFQSGSQTFLVAYRAPLKGVDLEKLFRDSDGKMKAVPRLPANTPLELTLLNTATMGSMSNVAQFDAAQVVPPLTPTQQKAAEAESQSAASMSNLKQIGLGLIEYTQDYDDKFPPMQGATKAQIEALGGRESTYTPSPTVQYRILPYVKNIQLFLQPGTNVPYQPNGSLSRRTLTSIDHTNTLVAFYEATPDAAGKRAVLFVDGHVSRINEKDWPQLRRASLVTIRLTGAAALYYAYKKHQTAHDVTGAKGQYFISKSVGRVYYRFLSGPDKGKFQWVAPPDKPLEVPYDTGQYLGLSYYQGYNGSTRGRTFGGYGNGVTQLPDAVPATL